MMARARNFGTELQMEQAKSLKLTSCENLARIGLTKFMTNWNHKLNQSQWSHSQCDTAQWKILSVYIMQAIYRQIYTI